MTSFFSARAACVSSYAALLLALASASASAASGSARPSNAEILFRLSNPCPVTGSPQGPCKGYVVDRVIPLVCGGADEPSNMRWLTLAEAKEKARWEKIGCRRGRKLVLPGGESIPTEAFGTGETPEPVRALPLGSAAPQDSATPE